MPDEAKKTEGPNEPCCGDECCGQGCVGEACHGDNCCRDDLNPTESHAPGAKHEPAPEVATGGCTGVCLEYEQNWKRALADYRNLQKDVAKEREMMGVYAVAHAVERFLPVLDYFKLAMEHKPAALADKSLANWASGIDHIQKQLEDALADLGLKKIPTVGEKFDATRHEAVDDESVDGKAHGVIVKEIQSGYELAGKVIRPAKVITAK
jgi:molecular chaperone GrpE